MRIKLVHAAGYSGISCVYVATGIFHGSASDLSIAALYAVMGIVSAIAIKSERTRTMAASLASNEKFETPNV